MNYLRRVLALSFVVVFGCPVFGKDHVSSNGQLSDENFYRQVACAAPVGRACTREMLHWPKRRLTIAIVDADQHVSQNLATSSLDALHRAMHEINGVRAGVQLFKPRSGPPDIEIYLTSGGNLTKHAMVRSVRKSVGSPSVGVARVFFENYKIQKSIIVIDVPKSGRALRSVMLEEVIQSLGLMTDIRNRFYHKRSIFSETGNHVVTLGQQDARALLLHYPVRQ